MRRGLIAVAIAAGFAFSTVPAAAQDSTDGPTDAPTQTSEPTTEETTPTPEETTPPPPVVTNSPSADATSGTGGSTSGGGGSTAGDGGSTSGAGGLPPGPDGLPAGTGSTIRTGVPPVSISAFDARAADIVILADSTDVRICHATNSDDNPYNVLPPATAGVANGHDKDDNGPIWNPTLKDLKIKWGDVIEPYTYNGVDYPGQNWDEDFYDSGCDPSPDIILVSAEPPTATDPTCEADGALELPETEGVSYSSSPAGTGPGTYTVTATADTGYEINGPDEFEITVLPKRTGEQCIVHEGDSTNVKICHRHNSNTNPYDLIPPATAGVANGHDEEHEGPIWDPTLKDLGIEWGDIIEPYTFNGVQYPGQNWAEGEAIFNAGCIVPDDPDEECPDEDDDDGDVVTGVVQSLDDDDEDCDEDDDGDDDDGDDDDGDDDDEEAALPDTGGPSQWNLLIGVLLTLLGMAILSNRESLVRGGLFSLVPADAPSVPEWSTFGRHAADPPMTVVKPQSRLDRLTELGAAALVAVAIFGHRRSK